MSNHANNLSRRLFLRHAASMSALGAGAPLAMNLAAMGSAAAATATGDYKALVCVFLTGGNDAFNTVLATDASSWSAYEAVRMQQPSSLALQRGSLLDLNPSTPLANGRTVALHPQLRDIRTLFNNRRLAVLANVGPLVDPITKTEYFQRQKRLPSKLFSHNDQQSTWQTMGPEGARLGWGGRLADAVASGNGKSLFTSISASGNAAWLNGQQVSPYQMQPSGVVRLGMQTTSAGADAVFGSTAAAEALRRIAQGNYSRHVFEKDLSKIGQRSLQADAYLGNQLPSASQAPFGGGAALQYTGVDGTSKALNPLAQQLQLVARMIAARSALGMSRQVFFISLGGFDTHDDQLNRHGDLMARLNHGLAYFDNVLQAMGMDDSVTTFTASDFGRTFTSNGDGTDHGWGGHHFIMGGAVRGGNVYGRLPIYSRKNVADNLFDDSPDLLRNGVMLPTTSVEQYGATLGRWFGAESVLGTVFPNLQNFGGPLSFMG